MEMGMEGVGNGVRRDGVRWDGMGWDMGQGGMGWDGNGWRGARLRGVAVDVGRYEESGHFMRNGFMGEGCQ